VHACVNLLREGLYSKSARRAVCVNLLLTSDDRHGGSSPWLLGKVKSLKETKSKAKGEFFKRAGWTKEVYFSFVEI
jgi:hypothetical protein